MYQNKMLTTAALICVCSAFIFFELSVGESDQRMFFIGWNWKMNGNKNVIDVIINDLNEHSIKPETEIVVAPPAIYLGYTRAKLDRSLGVAAQNCYKTQHGDFTGENSVEMIKDVDCWWVILGQMERRHIFGESDEFIGEKVKYALRAGLSVIACVGETLEEREAGKTEEVLSQQTKAVADNTEDWSKVVIAYEPVWAIGTGVTATPEKAQGAHETLRKWLNDHVSADAAKSVRVIYGGPGNYKELASQPDIDGFLVDYTARENFVEIVNARL